MNQIRFFPEKIKGWKNKILYIRWDYKKSILIDIVK